uniref:Uncharacterized protein n=1 Tax=Arundo donax TaxID=35708 RepID=A0A0A8ZFV8_ARUDO
MAGRLSCGTIYGLVAPSRRPFLQIQQRNPPQATCSMF